MMLSTGVSLKKLLESVMRLIAAARPVMTLGTAQIAFAIAFSITEATVISLASPNSETTGFTMPSLMNFDIAMKDSLNLSLFFMILSTGESKNMYFGSIMPIALATLSITLTTLFIIDDIWHSFIAVSFSTLESPIRATGAIMPSFISTTMELNHVLNLPLFFMIFSIGASEKNDVGSMNPMTLAVASIMVAVLWRMTDRAASRLATSLSSLLSDIFSITGLMMPSLTNSATDLKKPSILTMPFDILSTGEAEKNPGWVIGAMFSDIIFITGATSLSI